MSAGAAVQSAAVALTMSRCPSGEKAAACGARTGIFREEGVPYEELADLTRRPLFMEVPLGAFAGLDSESPIRDVPRRHATDAHEGGM